MWTIFAFIALGFLVGNLIGLTAESVTSAVLGLLFAFGGGSAIAFIRKLDPTERVLASKATLALSLSVLVGVYAGIVVSEYQLLTPDRQLASKRVSVSERKYLRESIISSVHSIDQRYANKQITLQEAYREMYQLVQKLESEAQVINKRYLNRNIKVKQAYRELYNLTAGED